MRWSQRGSAAAVVIGILVVALSAALGLIFYQNFIVTPADSPVPSPVTEEAAPRTKQVAFGGVIYELKYPANGWTANTTPVEGSKAGASDTYFVNIDGTVRVRFSLSEGGTGGMCDVNDKRRIGYYTVDTTRPNKQLTYEILYVVEAIYDGADGGYRYSIGLTPDGGATHAAVGQSPCNVVQIGVASRAVLDGDTVKQPTILAHITFPKLDENDGEQAEMQPIKDMLQTEEFKQAVSILLSARKK
ncbi:hypothetical protein PV379_00570 [Streptomyces caniscabiei]|uniref:hypothetical protein n=1 Tax=Streptomyces caniscabiei TaxID=2746961 RepID=UPI0029BC931E|nr:hypothetical protein [Streptomyces caniscabiei]MDX2775850.1 hypothetical protein [Streptomyces caniscabiei]